MYFWAVHFHRFWFKYLVTRDDNSVFDYVNNIFNKGACEAVTKECQINYAMNIVLSYQVHGGVVVC
jgi:hypothetical protein